MKKYAFGITTRVKAIPYKHCMSPHSPKLAVMSKRGLKDKRVLNDIHLFYVVVLHFPVNLHPLHWYALPQIIRYYGISSGVERVHRWGKPSH